MIETSREYARALLRGVAQYNEEYGPWSIYFEPHGLDDPPPAWLAKWKGDGLLARIGNAAIADAVMQTGLPAIDLRGVLPDLPVPFLGVDNQAVAALAFEHFQSRGFQHFAFFGLPRGEHPHMDERCDEFVNQVARHGGVCHVYPERQFVDVSSSTWEQQQMQLGRWVISLPRPVAAMVCHDDLGLRLIDACRRAEVVVPEEVAVVSVDNDEHLCSLSTPPMTSIDVNARLIGYEAAGMLHQWMMGKKPEKLRHFYRPTAIVERLSSDSLAIPDRDISLAVRYIRENAVRGIGVADVLQEVAISRSSLERRFRHWLGRSPKAEIVRVQMQRARALLAKSDISLIDVAAQAGFSDAKYFSEAFTRTIGVPPTQYRKQNKIVHAR